MKLTTGIVLAAVLLQSAHAVEKSDFAYGFALQVDGDGAIYSLDLPEEVYRGLTRADRGDLRVFNGSGDAVPHFIRRAEQRSARQTVASTLPLFPVHENGDSQTPGTHPRLHISTDASGAIVDIDYDADAVNIEKPTAYILDASQLDSSPAALLVRWPDDQADFVATVSVEQSDDLAHWQNLASGLSLSNLHYAGHTLQQQRLELPLKKFKYLRLRWQSSQALTLNEVGAEFPTRYYAQERLWTPVNIHHIDNENHYYYFNTGSLLPIDRLAITLPQRNTLSQIHVESAVSASGPWRSRYSGLVYDLQFSGKRLTSPQIILDTTSDGYWRLRFDKDTPPPAGNLQLRLGWIPEQLLFIAQGEPPFVLAYASTHVSGSEAPLPQLLNVEEIDADLLVKTAHLGLALTLGSADNLLARADPPNWQRYALWSVLILGVILLSWMAWRLYREMARTA